MINNNLQLTIKRRSQPEWLLMTIIFIPLICGFLIDVAHIPSAIKYSIDLALVLIVVLAAINLSRKKIYIIKSSRIFYIWIGLFLCVTFIVYITQYQTFLYYIWGFRNNFRFYIAFFAFALFFKKENIDGILKFFDIFFWVNSALCVVQFFAFDLRGDFLGGFFGTEKGCNGYLNVFMAVIVIKAIVYYLGKKESLLYCILICASSLVVAALAELKFFFVEFIVILFVALFISETSLRKILIFAIGLVIIVVGASILTFLSPHFANFLSIDYIIESTSTGGYASNEQLNRLTTIPIISEEILTTPSMKWFGLGLGNCDTANFEFLKTPFYFDYIHLRYNWFSTSFLYLETGFIGLIFFFGFFLLVGIKSFLMAKKDYLNRPYYQMSLIAAVVCVMIAIYNASLRTEAGYLIYFMLALPLIIKKGEVEYDE